MYTTNNRNFYSIFFATTLTILLIFSVLFLACKVIKRNSENSCYSTMENAASQIGSEILTSFNSDMEHLSEIASIIAQYEAIDGPYAKKAIMSFKGSHTISHLEMLLSNNTVITSCGETIPAANERNFDDEAVKGMYISQLTTDISHHNKKIICESVPVVKNGTTVAILYGIVDVSRLPKLFKSAIYSGQTNVYIIAGESGELIMNTGSDPITNINSISSFRPKKDYRHIDIISDIHNGNKGYSVFKLPQSDSYTYICYLPIGINDWMGVLTLPESVVLKNARNSMIILYLLSAAILIVLSIYFAALLMRLRFELGTISYMFDISQLLNGTGNGGDSFNKPLAYVANSMNAEISFFAGIEDGIITDVYINKADSSLESELITALKPLYEYLKSSGNIVSSDFSLISELKEKYHINNYMAASSKDANNNIVGIIGVINLPKKQKSMQRLKSISSMFSMALTNYNSYHTIRHLSMTDSLTGLKNRNCFERRIKDYELSTPHNFSCVYMDANGLHALNNSQGHEAGDAMLRCIADCLKGEFGDICYRIGGDEFVVLVHDTDNETIHRRADKVCNEISKHGYHVSVGIHFSETPDDIDNVVNTAEKNMQNDKYRYYQTKNIQKTILSKNSGSIMNRQVSHQNLHIFLSVIAPLFYGAYLVNLDNDTKEAIYDSPYFKEMFRYFDDKFSSVIKLYVSEQVSSDYQREFAMLFDYEWIIHQLNSGASPRLRYKKTDGCYVVVRVMKSPHYNETNHETVWIFKNGNDTIE